MTSNLGSETIFEICNKQEEGKPDKDEIIDEIRPELTSHFQASLLARCRIIPFCPLDMEAMKSIVRLKLEKIVKRLKDVHDIDFEYSPELVESIAEQCSTVESGARNIDVIIDQTLLPTISMTLLSQLCNEEEPYKRVIVSYSEEENFSITFE
jgi:type VI secretion system protein VasG